MDKGAGVNGEDVPTQNLVPLHERAVKKSSYKKLRASIQAIGLIEPILVYLEAGKYLILDGFLRYRACRELGITTVPCLILPTKEAYTPNRMVNHLSGVQENRMLAQSLGTLDEATIAGALGLASIRHRIQARVLKRLHPDVVRVFDEKNVPLRICSRSLSFVKPEYQLVVLEEMKKTGDFSPAFARSLIMRAPSEMRIDRGRRSPPWGRSGETKTALASKLGEAEKRYEFYAGLYRQYVADLLKLSMYVRRMVTNEKIEAYLKSRHPDLLGRFQEILFETGGERGAEVRASGADVSKWQE